MKKIAILISSISITILSTISFSLLTEDYRLDMEMNVDLMYREYIYDLNSKPNTLPRYSGNKNGMNIKMDQVAIETGPAKEINYKTKTVSPGTTSFNSTHRNNAINYSPEPKKTEQSSPGFAATPLLLAGSSSSVQNLHSEAGNGLSTRLNYNRPDMQNMLLSENEWPSNILPPSDGAGDSDIIMVPIGNGILIFLFLSLVYIIMRSMHRLHKKQSH